MQAGTVQAVALIAAVIERYGDLGNGLDAGVDLARQIKAAGVAERLGFLQQLLVYLEMPRGHIVQQHLAQTLQGRTAQCSLFALQFIEYLYQLMAFLQPAVDQQVHTSPAFLGVPTALEHDDLTSLIDVVCCAFRTCCPRRSALGEWQHRTKIDAAHADYASTPEASSRADQMLSGRQYRGNMPIRHLDHPAQRSFHHMEIASVAAQHLPEAEQHHGDERQQGPFGNTHAEPGPADFGALGRAMQHQASNLLE